MTNYKTLALAAILSIGLAQSFAFAQADDDDDAKAAPEPKAAMQAKPPAITRGSKNVPELILGSKDDEFTVNQKDFELVAGQGYRWKITSAAGLEYKFVTDLFRNVWMNQIVINDLEVHMDGGPAWLEFDVAGDDQRTIYGGAARQIHLVRARPCRQGNEGYDHHQIAVSLRQGRRRIRYQGWSLMGTNAGLRNINDKSMPEANLPALDLASVSYAYGKRQALENVTFSIAPGRFAVLLGLNGAGKTTLFSLISHLFATRHGRIHVFGHDIDRRPGDALRRLGIVFQARTLDLDLSVHQNLSYHASLHGIRSREANRRIHDLMQSIDMSDRLHEKARSLSGGQIRRVEIVRALLHEPSLLLLDEATVGLDIKSRATILADIRKLVEEKGISVLWATHLIDEVSHADQVIVLNQGKLVANGPVHEVVKNAGAETINEAFSRLTGIYALNAGNRL